MAVLVESGAAAAGGLALRLASEGLAAVADGVDGRRYVLDALCAAIDERDAEAADRMLAVARRSWPGDVDVAYYGAIMCRLWPERAEPVIVGRKDWR